MSLRLTVFSSRWLGNGKAAQFAVVLLGFLALNSLACAAAEPAAEFIAKLKERRYYDMVQAYYERLQIANTTVDGLGSFESEQAITAAQLAAQETNPTERAVLMESAKEILSDFVFKSPDDPAVETAQEWIRKILFEQARVKIARAGLTVDESKQKKLLDEGDVYFVEAQKAADAHVEYLKGKFLEFRKLPKEKQDSDVNEALQSDYLQAKLTAATVMYESAAALKWQEKLREARLVAAAAAAEKLTEDYPNFIAGFVGIMLRGQALKDLGKHEEAIEALNALATTEEPALRVLSLEAVGQIIDCHVLANSHDEGIELGKKWLKDLGTADRNEPPVQGLQLALARAYGDKAADAKGGEQRKLTGEARRLLAPIVRAPGRNQQKAKAILTSLPGETEEASVAVDDLKTYDDAKSAGDMATQESQAAQQMMAVIKGRLRTAGPGEKDTLKQEITSLETTVKDESRKALQFYREAIRMAPSDTDPGEINMMRLISCFAYYGNGDYFSAAVVGEFLARRFPEEPTARRAASIAMASYYQLFEQADGAGSKDEAASAYRKLVSIADYLSKKWPDEPEAQQALITLVTFMVKQGELTKAQDYLNKIPVDSPKRGQADLVTGQAIWTKYLAGIKAADGATTPELDALKKQAQSVLQGGVDRMKKAGPSSGLANAMLNLARIYNDSGDPDKALSLLLDPKVGPKTLVDKKDPSAQAQNFDSLTYQTVLQAQLASIASAKNKNAVMKEAQQTMADMGKIYGEDEKGKKRMIATFRRMAMELGEQLKLAQPNEKAAFASGIETFLLQVQSASNEFNVLYWVAETMYSLGESFLGADEKMTPQAKQYFERAAASYSDITKRAADGKLQLNQKLATQVRMRAASTKARLGDFEAATVDFTAILKQNEKILSIQIEAANAFKVGGAMKKDNDLLIKAIKGAVPNPNTRKMTIWGWERIGLLTRPLMDKKASMKETFFKSQYNLVECRFLQFQITGEKKYFDSATSILNRMEGSYPEMGGAIWKPKFQKLKQDIAAAPAAG